MGKKKEDLIKFVVEKLEGLTRKDCHVWDDTIDWDIDKSGEFVEFKDIESIIKEVEEQSDVVEPWCKVGDVLVCTIDAKGYSKGNEYPIKFNICDGVHIIDDDGYKWFYNDWWEVRFTIKN